MRPAPSPLPLLRVVSTVMAFLALLFAAHLLWQRHESDLAIASRYSNADLRDHLVSGLQWLGSTVQPGRADEQPVVCPARAGDAIALELEQWRCARAALNAKLAEIGPEHHIPAESPDETLQPSILKAIKWLTRNARDGKHALGLIRNPEQTANQISFRDPFRLSGCLYASPDGQADPLNSAACPDGRVVTDSDTPPHMQSLLYPIHEYRSAARGDSPNTLNWESASGMETPLIQGRHVSVAWNSRIQSQAQITAACYAGDADACQKCTWCNKAKSRKMFEGARVRAMGILIVDVKTGAIDAAASAYTPCYAAHQRGTPASADCPLFPTVATRQRLDRSFRLGNQALLQNAMPGSQAKLPIALGLMQAGLSPKEAASLPSILTRSATEELIDLALCKERDFLPSCARHRLSSIKKVALGMGWQSQADVLARGQAKGLRSTQFAGRLMELPTYNDGRSSEPRLDQAAMRQCGLKPVQERWRNCRGADLVNAVAELFGQGNSLTSPIGIADGLLQLAAAGNGQRTSNGAHLLASFQDSKGATHPIEEKRPLAFDYRSAAPVLRGLSLTHSTGTARSACVSARAAANGMPWAIPCGPESPRGAELSPIRIASKTGTPVFSADKLTLPQWRASCVLVAAELETAHKGQPRWYHLRNELAKCGMTPIKWYAMLIGRPGTNIWDKVAVVIAERNWNRATQIVDSARDLETNVAAEAGLALANALYSKSSANRNGG
jgi:hypothetical protein